MITKTAVLTRGKSALLACSIAILLLQLFAPRLSAQQGTGSGLSISPTRTDLRLDPGKTDILRISLRNVTTGDIVAKAFVNDFESDNETGEPKINLDVDADNPASIRDFLKNVNDVPLKVGEEKTFDIPIQIPANTAPGAYYGIIRYAAVPASQVNPDAGQVSLTASVASIVLIEVAGEIKEELEFKQLYFYRAGTQRGIFTSQPDQVGVEVVNRGNSFARPFGTVTVKNPFGGGIQSIEVNNASPRSNILPGSSRIFKEPISNIKWPGQYQVTGSISYSNGGEILIVKSSFWYIPIWFIVALAVLVLAIIGAVQILRRRLRQVRHRK